LKQANMFVTAAVVGRADPGRLAYVLAGHPALVHVDGATGRARWVGDSQIAVGFKEDVTYTASVIDFRPGDLVTVVTDGLIEVFDRGRHELGADGLLRIVEAAARRERLSESAEEIFQACAKYGAQSDDQSLLLVSRLRT
jgi:serine phosphatase RsbU (regulator of sigma subunit)